ncbi:AraC family transcriptional regulator [Thaumasiovibrio subtropicus]|uniref:AraC family transcriptional regulator n=1 Tax=Thaumasiovibrio subtropicus TaxID=1891207 RepID=UPI000B3514C5|nr:AraC family transcriptional regulator [Thaumasiovibrio subtropicus]
MAKQRGDYQAVSANRWIEMYPQRHVHIREISMPNGHIDHWHRHPWHQIIFPQRGMLSNQSGDDYFFLPESHGILVPAGVPHESTALANTEFVGIYLNPNAPCCQTVTSTRCTRLTPSAFLSHLVPHLIDSLCMAEQHCFQSQRRTMKTHQEEPAALHHLITVLLDQQAKYDNSSLTLSLPDDPLLRRLTHALIQSPHCALPLTAWASDLGCSPRTLSRRFQQQLGTTFPRWRQQVRLLLSLSLLSDGLPIQVIAHRMSYQSDSAFIHAFHAYFGCSPQQFRQRHILKPDQDAAPE